VSSNGRGKVTIQQDIDITSAEKGSVMVRDAAGKEVYNSLLSGSETVFELNTPSGVYFVEVQLNGQVEVKKIFVQQ
jgi:methylase of polypeptide subunit release factors